MKKISKIILSLIILIFINSCSGMSDAGKVLRNEKTKTTDEFLVKKRQPLTLPPDIDNLPKPNSINEKKESNEDNIQSVIKIPKDRVSPSGKATSVEQSIINKIEQ